MLHNWLGPVADKPATIDLQATRLAGRQVFVYAGNMGVAQGLDVLIDMARQLRYRPDIGFLFVGRGSDVSRLAQKARSLNLDNVLFCDEIDPDEIPALYAQCAVGLVALDPRHRLHNIPGKFLTYLQCGLPVLANVNPDNDIAGLIRGSSVGKVAEGGTADQLAQMALEMVEDQDREGEAGQALQGAVCATVLGRYSRRTDRRRNSVFWTPLRIAAVPEGLNCSPLLKCRAATLRQH